MTPHVLSTRIAKPIPHQGASPMTPSKRARDMLIEEDLVSTTQVEDALRMQETRGGKLIEVLMDLGHLDVHEFEKFIVGQPGIASINLSQYRIMSEICDLIPEDMARAQQIFPIDKMGKLLTIGMAMPMDTDTISRIAELTGLRVKAVYCNLDHVRGAIDQYYPKQEADVPDDSPDPETSVDKPPNLENVATLLRGIDDLPALPETVSKTKEAMDDPTIAMDEIAALIQIDPLISAKVLKLANSSAYKFVRRVDNVETAMRLLGLQEAYNLVLASSVMAMTEGAKGFNYQRFWQEALFTASAVPLIAAKSGNRSTPALSTAGLLHDIGRFALVHVSSAEYAKIADSYTGKELVSVEEKLLGLGHPEAGYIVADHWELPDEITTLIRFHHTPERADNLQIEAATLSVAAFLSEAHSSQTDLENSEAFEEIRSVIEHLGLSTEQLLEIYGEIASTLAA